MCLGFQHLYTEVDSLELLQQVVKLYFTNEIKSRNDLSIGVRIIRKGEKPELPWTLRSQPEVFPLMLISTALLPPPKGISYDPWHGLHGEPTHILRPTGSYLALDQLLDQLGHYIKLYDSAWREMDLPREPDCDGSIEAGFSVSAGNYEGPLVIGWAWAEYHK